MVQQHDTLWQSEGFIATDTPIVAKPHKLTPAEVASWLPRNATPAQLDSAIQKYIKPSEIHWSERPETLRLPGQELVKSFYDLSVPQDYRDTYFSKSDFTHSDIEAARTGVAGDPIPYTIANDNLVTGLLLACFVLALLAFQKSRRLIVRQAKTFFYVERSDKTTTITETSGEVRSQLFLVAQTCLLFALIYFFYIQKYISDTFIIEQYQAIGIFTAVTAVYFLLKAVLYGVVHWTFFDSKKNEQWIKCFLFLVSMEGVVLFPIVMLQTYFNISVRTTCIYAVCVAILFKILTLYKSRLIFFRQKGSFLQIILYFCALELIPLSLLGGFLSLISNYLKINF